MTGSPACLSFICHWKSHQPAPTSAYEPASAPPPLSALEQDKGLPAPTGAYGQKCSHNPKVTGSNPVPATKVIPAQRLFLVPTGKGLLHVHVPNMYHAGRTLPSPTVCWGGKSVVRDASLLSRWWVWERLLAPTGLCRQRPFCWTSTASQSVWGPRHASCDDWWRNGASRT
jgi:hypothetical protein